MSLFKTKTWLCSLVLSLAVALILVLVAGAVGSSPEDILAQPPGTDHAQNGITRTMTGGFSPISVEITTPQTMTHVTSPGAPAFGALVYDPDFKMVEAEARALLARNKAFREDISPHNEKPNFEQLVRQFDASGGFSAVYTSTMTLQDRLDIADAELRQARDMYAYLAVYAPVARFREDAEVDCLAGAVDWCNFPARMRESLREAAYLRMIFGQQFTADALGFRFGADIVGGEDFVRDEVNKLEMAADQFQLAREAVYEGLDRYVGNGCYVYDFYTADEWVLLSRAVEGLERARHHIAVRKSYLAPTEDEWPSAQADAVQTLRAAAIDQYVDMIRTASLRAERPQCEGGTRPDNNMVAKMAAHMLSTRESAREMQEGRNVFGFDVSFTPARPYRTAAGSTDTGLWEEARSRALTAKEAQDDAAENERWFDWQEYQLGLELDKVKERYDLRLGALTGCNTSLPDGDFFNCVDKAAGKLQGCDPLEEDEAVFIACLDATGAGGELREAWEDLRTAFLEVKRTQKELENLAGRQIIELERSATVRHEIMTNGRDQALMEFVATLLDSFQVSVGTTVEAGLLGPEFSVSVSVSNNPYQPVIAGLRSGQTLRQAVADANIEGANSEAVVRNLLLDAVELQVELEIAAHKAQAQLTVFKNLASGTQDLAVEARRARVYVAQSPANDPSFRLVRDSVRLQLAEDLEYAARVSYMAAKRAEYEYAARLVASGNFRLSDIYRARTATDIINFLDDLEATTNNLVVSDAEVGRDGFTLSIARHVLGWTDEELGLTGEAARAERARRFREWVADHTETWTDGETVLVFTFVTSPDDEGVFSNVTQGYERFWLHKVAGIGQPKPESIGFGMNLVTSQAGDLEHRTAYVTQSGLVHLKARSGCIFEYRLIHPAALLGLEWPDDQDPEIATGRVEASVNDSAFGERTAAFLGRPVSATGWQVLLYADEDGLPDMDLQQLEDIELLFDTTYVLRDPGDPDPEDCIRIDY